MKALRLHGPMDLRVDEIPEPFPGPGEVKVKTEYCGLCGSDKPRLLDGKVPFLPSTIGHEFSGTVVEVGDGVKSVRPGDVVAAIPLIVCHNCPHCRSGHYGQCQNKKFIGLRVENVGAFAKYNVLPECNVIKVPDGVSNVQAAFIEPISVALHAIFRSGLKPGNDVAVIGTGAIGQLLIQCLRHLGAHRIYTFDIDDGQLERAEIYGADYCFNMKKKDFMDEYLTKTDGLGCPVVYEAVGLQGSILQSLDICRVRGNIALVGYLDQSVPSLRRPCGGCWRQSLT